VGRVVAVCTAAVEHVEIEGRVEPTAIRKQPVDGPVMARGDALAGDGVGDPGNHGGELMAVYAFAQEDADWFARQWDRELPPGILGENLRTQDVDVTGAKVGERWRVGDALLEVTTIRVPCYKLGWTLGDPDKVRAFARAARPGAYLTIVEPGEISADDEVRVVRSREDHHVTMGLLATAYHVERRLRADVLEEVDLLPPAAGRRARQLAGG